MGYWKEVHRCEWKEEEEGEVESEAGHRELIQSGPLHRLGDRRTELGGYAACDLSPEGQA